jgi:hypothetical protein
VVHLKSPEDSMGRDAIVTGEQTVSGDSTRPEKIPAWVGAVAIVGGLLMILGAVLGIVRPSMLAGPDAVLIGAVEVFAGYFAVRNLVLGLLLPVLLAIGARRSLGNLLAIIGLVQLLDVCMDCVEGRWAIVPGVLLLGVLYLAAAARVSGGAFWRRRAWL